MKKNFIIILAIFFATQITADTTYVSGGISTNTVWDTAGSPYIVTGNVTVDGSVTLQIKPGVKIAIDSGISIIINGTLNAIGTSTDSIIFTEIAPYRGWDKLGFSSASHCSLKYCKVGSAATTGLGRIQGPGGLLPGGRSQGALRTALAGPEPA